MRPLFALFFMVIAVGQELNALAWDLWAPWPWF